MSTRSQGALLLISILSLEYLLERAVYHGGPSHPWIAAFAIFWLLVLWYHERRYAAIHRQLFIDWMALSDAVRKERLCSSSTKE